MREVDLQSLIPEDLPRGAEVIEAGRARARDLDLPRTLYLERRGAPSDRALKERRRGQGEVECYVNLGYKTWAETADALGELVARGRREGFRLDRVSLIPDRRMGLPEDLRGRAHEETGLMMYGPRDWRGAARDVDVQPILNDHNVGSPNAIANTTDALLAGFGYIGNLAQQNYGYPLWDDDVEQMRLAVEAMAMLAEKREAGVVLESYIEDGYCAGFHDLTTSLGFCLFHRYVSETLIGAAHSQSYGSTFTDPLRKQAFGLALDEINVGGVPRSFTHGDTNSFETDDSFERNAAAVMNDVTYTIMRELAFPSGGAVHATPVSEAVRIPTIDELAQSLVIVDEATRRAREGLKLMDWRPVLALRDEIVAGGRRFFDNLLSGLSSLGVDRDDPLQLLLATRRLGGTRLEEHFGIGEADDAFPRGRRAVVPSDTLLRLLRKRDEVIADLRAGGAGLDLRGQRVVAGSGDVHEYGLFVVSTVLTELGAEVTDLGTSVTADELAKAAAEVDAHAICLSTYNGMALSLGSQLVDEARGRRLRAGVYVGGRLNQDLEGVPAADVRPHLREAGAVPCDDIQQLVAALAPLRSGAA